MLAAGNMYEACTAGDPVGVICDASHWWYAHHCWINDVILTIMSIIVITVLLEIAIRKKYTYIFLAKSKNMEIKCSH